VAATEYVLPAPITKRFVRFGVLLVPSHNTHPLGIEAIDPLHMIMPPDGKDAGNAADTHAVPLLDKTLPDVPGDTEVTAEVPLPINTPAEVRVAAPVPPLTTEVTPAVEMDDTKTKSEPFHATVAEVPLAMETPVVGPTPRINTAYPPVVLLMTT
jgi:hypothetical protein